MTSADELLKRYCGKMTVEMKNGESLELKMPSPRDMTVLMESLGNTTEADMTPKEMSQFFVGIGEVATNILKKTYPDASDDVLEDMVSSNFAELSKTILDVITNMQSMGNENVKPRGIKPSSSKRAIKQTKE